MQRELQISKGSRNNSEIRDPLSELSQEDDSNEGSQHMFYRNIRKMIWKGDTVAQCVKCWPTD